MENGSDGEGRDIVPPKKWYGHVFNQFIWWRCVQWTTKQTKRESANFHN